jgi:ATP-dependent Clp protease ATP-binding subunit ClpA
MIRAGDDGIAMMAISELGVSGEDLRKAVLALVKPGRPDTRTGPDLPYASPAKKVLELAMAEARQLDHAYVGTEHLLLGMLREGKGIAAQALGNAGIDIEKAGNAVLRTLASQPPGSRIDPRPDGSVQFPRPDGSVHFQVSDVPGPVNFLPEPARTVIAAAYTAATAGGKRAPNAGDLLSAVVSSLPEVAAAFAARKVDIASVIEEVRRASEQ